jgi:hypothetical protein
MEFTSTPYVFMAYCLGTGATLPFDDYDDNDVNSILTGE